MSLRGVMTPVSVGVMTLAIGQKVRYVGSAHPINHGSIGTVTRMGQILDDCPVVHFPFGTHGPHSDFLIITHERDLEPVR